MSSQQSHLFTSLAFAAGLCSSALLFSVFSSQQSQPSLKQCSNSSISKPSTSPILAIGSANADIFVVCDGKLPKSGETTGGSLKLVGPGGKGSNQAAAACKAAKDSHHVHLITSMGQDEHAEMFRSAYQSLSMPTTILTHPDATGTIDPTGQAYILLETASRDNSIIVCPGANMKFPSNYHLYPQMYNHDGELQCNAAQFEASNHQQQKIQQNSTTFSKCILDHIGQENRSALLNARVVLMQREIPDSVNLLFAFVSQHVNQFYNFKTKSCTCCSPSSSTTNSGIQQQSSMKKDHKTPRITVMLDVGGIGDTIDLNILPYIDVLSFNETEMGRVYQQAFSYLPSHIKNSKENDLLQLYHVLDEHSGAIHMPLLSSSSNISQLKQNNQENGSTNPNAAISLLQDYSIFSPRASSNTTIQPDQIATAYIDYSKITQKKQIPFDMSFVLHATHAITAMCTSQLPESTLPLFADKAPLKLLVTLGTKGSLLLTSDEILHYQAPMKLLESEIVDSTGCGDAYRGSFATAYYEQLVSQNTENNENGVDFAAIMRFATAAATVCLGKMGTLPAMGTRVQVEALLPRVPMMSE